MAVRQHTPRITESASSDQQLSPQAVAVAAALLNGEDIDALGLQPEAINLAVWELQRAHAGGGKNV